MPTCTPATIVIPSEFIFPAHAPHTAYTPVDIAIAGCGAFGDGLANLPHGPAHLTIPMRQHGHPDSDSNWVDSGWWVNEDVEIRYESRDDSHLYGVTKYPDRAKIDAGAWASTGYYNPNAYWVPPTSDPVPPADIPPGADPDATFGQDPTTTDPPDYTEYGNRPYKYAVMKTYDLMGTNRTGIDLDEDPDHPGTFFDPADAPVLSFLYDDQHPLDSNLANMDWEPDGEATKNQQVALMSAATENARKVRRIARNMTSWKEIGVYGDWDGISGQNVGDVSADNVAGHARAEVERYQRPPNHFTLYLHIEPATSTPERGTGETPAIGWQPQPFRDFNLGDRILARMRKGFLDSGQIVGRIMHFDIKQADPNNNVVVEIQCVPHSGDLSEITVVE